MELDRLQFQVKQSIKHQQSILSTLAAPHSDLGGNLSQTLHVYLHKLMFLITLTYIAQDAIGGVLRNGQLGWTALGSHISVVFLKTGNRVSSYNFESFP